MYASSENDAASTGARLDDDVDAFAEAADRLGHERDTRSPVADSFGMPRRIARSYRIARRSQSERRTSSRLLHWLDVTNLLLQYGLVLLFALVAIESAGVPLPGETALITAAFFARRSTTTGRSSR